MRLVAMGIVAIALLCTMTSHAGAQLMSPGNHTDVSTLENEDWKFETLIPDLAASESKPLLPVFFLWGRMDDKTLLVLTEWANERGVILVANRTKFHKTGSATIDNIIDATDKTISAYTHVHR